MAIAKTSVLVAMLASGCTVGPDFTQPTTPATNYAASDETPPANAGSRAPKQSFVPGGKLAPKWWTLFRSPALDSVVGQAVTGSFTLQGAQARVTQAQEAIAAASSGLYPQVDFTAGVTRERVTATSFGLKPTAFPLPPNFNLFQLGPTVRYPLDIFGGTRRQVEQQAALADLQTYQLDAAYLTLTGNTVSQAIQAAGIRAQLKAIADILAIDHRNINLVRTERAAGSVPDSDVVTAQSQLAADETLRPGLDQQLSTTRHALAVLVGQAPADWSPPEFELASLELPEQLPLSLPSELIHQRPDILAAEARLHAASAEIGVATARLYPAITLSGSVGSAALDPGHLFDPAALVWSIAAGLTQPVFDGGLRRAEQRAALAAFKAAAADYQQTVLQAFGQIADALQALAHDADLLSAQQRALDTASEAIRLQRLNYAAGGSGILDLLDIQRQYQQALLGYARAQAQRYQDTAQLLVAMGGGGGWTDKLVVARAF
jgi:NodT family efflux transporter outer membrane factor (OMF) lipoprotein